MFKPARNLPTGRRSFRLAPLEMMIIGLIALGVLFLISMWVRTLFSSGSVEEAQPSANAAQVEQVLGTTETLRAQVAELQTKLGRLGDRVQGGGLGSGQAAPKNWEKRLKDMQEQIDRLGHAEAAAEWAKLAKRVAELEKRPAHDPELIKRLDEVQKQVEAIPQTDLKPIEDRLAAMEKSLSRLDKAPEVLAKSITTLEKRVVRMEKEISRRPEAPDRPAGPTPEVLSRLEKLEENAGPRLDEINKRLVGVEKSLDRVGHDLASARQAAGKQAAPTPDARMAARLEKLEQAAEAQGEETRKISQQLAGLNRALNRLGQEQERPAPQASQAPDKPKPQVKPKPAPADTSDFTRYKVRRGDTLYGIARRHRVTVAQIKEWNPKLKRRRYLWVGETLLINPGARD